MKIETALYSWTRCSGGLGLPLPAVAFSKTWREDEQEMEQQVIVPDSWLHEHGYRSLSFTEEDIQAIFAEAGA